MMSNLLGEDIHRCILNNEKTWLTLPIEKNIDTKINEMEFKKMLS